ncbi:G-protein coupled receptor dmsr-1-like isoform X2 [Prorops nasuta]|uniref:G-protein coupled receptor dmsr-1-like isoform X2 n=1 Tax=Prorops nasuta TaxID=863751 RepID=UPI0034CD8BFE
MNSSNVSLSSWEYKCGTGLKDFRDWYVGIHGWSSLLVCIFGSIANSLNIAVLTRREMRSPTNLILSGLAVADLLVMLEYIPLSIHMYLYKRSKRDTYSYGWTVFVLFHSSFAQVCHTVSIWLTVTLAIWRYIAVAYPQRNRELCSYRRTIFAILAAYVICPIICIPLYITTEVYSRVESLDLDGNISSDGAGAINTTLYYVRLTETTNSTGDSEDLMNFWIYSVVIKLIPCLALTILILSLVMVLLRVKKRRKVLTSTALLSSSEMTKGQRTKGKKSLRTIDKQRQTDRTGMMLFAVLILFLLTELPQGILGLLRVVLGKGFFQTCYVMLVTSRHRRNA